jgi:hypothetical protein
MQKNSYVADTVLIGLTIGVQYAGNFYTTGTLFKNRGFDGPSAETSKN